MPRAVSSISIFLASPSDVDAEREVIFSSIQQWNTVNSRHRNVTFDVLRWETSISAGFGADGQQVINAQINDDYDVIIAVFWSKFGTETPRARSGTVEEYERALSRYRSGDPIEIAFFFKSCPVDFRKVDLDNLKLLKNFEEEIHAAGALSKSFIDNDGLRFEIDILLDRLAREVAENGGQLRRAHPAESSLQRGVEAKDEVEEDEAGIFDVAERLEGSSDSSSQFLSELTDHLDRLTACTSESADKITEITKLRPITPAEARPIIEVLAKEMNDFSRFLEEKSSGFDEDVTLTTNLIRSMVNISYDFLDAPDAESHLTNFQSVLHELYRSMQGSEDGMSALLASTIGLQRTTADFNRAKKRLVRNLGSYIEAVKGHRAILSQAIQELVILLIEVRNRKGDEQE
jgi:hypothetical protein